LNSDIILADEQLTLLHGVEGGRLQFAEDVGDIIREPSYFVRCSATIILLDGDLGGIILGAQGIVHT
jgi:hypothetical protein